LLFKIKACVPGRRFLAYFFGAVAKEVSRQRGEKVTFGVTNSFNKQNKTTVTG